MSITKLYKSTKRKSTKRKSTKRKSTKRKSTKRESNDGMKTVVDEIRNRYKTISEDLYQIIIERIINILSNELEEKGFIPFTDKEIVNYIDEHKEEIWNMITEIIEEHGIKQLKNPTTELIYPYLYKYLPLPTILYDKSLGVNVLRR